jgi:hypothetical protein
MRRWVLLAMLGWPCLSMSAPIGTPSQTAAEQFYDQAFAGFVHDEFVVDVLRSLRQDMEKQAVTALGSQAQVDACSGLKPAIARLVAEDMGAALEDAYTDARTRTAFVAAVRDSVPAERLQGYLRQVPSGKTETVRLMLVAEPEFLAGMGEAIKNSPLNMNTNTQARERIIAGARRVAPIVERCKGSASS